MSQNWGFHGPKISFLLGCKEYLIGKTKFLMVSIGIFLWYVIYFNLGKKLKSDNLLHINNLL